MTCATATFHEVSAFDGRALALRGCSRVILGGVFIGVGSVAAACIVVGLATVAAAWMLSASLSRNPYLHARAPMGAETIALDYHYPGPIGPTDISASAPGLVGPPPVANIALEAGPAALATSGQLPAVVAPDPATSSTAAAAVTRVAVHRRPHIRMSDQTPGAANPADPESTSTVAHSTVPAVIPIPPALPTDPVKTAPPPTQVAALPPAASPTAQRPTASEPAPSNSMSPPARDSHVAVYDIAAHTVYLPGGERLEAHSGLGKRLDDPRYVSEKNRGPTPPNVYDLKLRGELFHGVRAIRLNPVGEARMFGRDGILAHTYMLGPSGQSFGCVSFKNYAAFLRAYLKGDFDRLVVVPHLETAPSLAGPLRRRQAAAYDESSDRLN